MAKTIVISKTKAAEFPKRNMPHAMQDTERYGVWCKVLKRHSIDHTVDVETAEGFQVTRIPVTSSVWATLEDPVLGGRNLPPVGSMVFMFMPTRGIDNAFIFGSCFLPSFDKHTGEFLVDGKEDEELDKTEGGWQRKKDKVTGDLEIIGIDEDDKTLTITIKKSEKKIQLKDWNDNDIVIDENGIAEIIIKQRSIEAEEDVSIKSKKGAMTFKTASIKLVEIGNAINTLGKMGSTLFQTLITMKTVGHPGQHVVSPDDIAKFVQQKATWDQVFK
jgi:hypothetical protein